MTVRRIGLTGGIGSGKSTVAAMLVAHGATLVDTDAIARGMTEPQGAAIPALVQAFGPDVIDGSGALDRAAMRALVFGDPAARLRLEGILHPLIGHECERQAGMASGPVVFDVPLLVESGRWRSRVERILVVDAPVETQIQRVMSRSAWPRETVEKVVAQQASRPARRAAADAVVYNDGKSLDALAREVGLIWHRWFDER